MEPAYRILNVHAWSINGLSCGTDITLSRVAGLNESTNDLFIQGIIFETLFLLGTKCSKLC